jgi:ABC-type dipeptide/oligopeptide/nickel transport system permease component
MEPVAVVILLALTRTAIRNRDFPDIQGTTLVFALIYVMTSLAVDFIHGALDPRVRRKML